MITTCPFCGGPLDKDGLSPSLSVPVEAVEAARRLLEIDDTGLVKEDDVNLVANTLLAMAGKE
jgi:hypothetical protein